MIFLWQVEVSATQGEYLQSEMSGGQFKPKT